MLKAFVKDVACRIPAGRVPTFLLCGAEGQGGSLLAMHLRPMIRGVTGRPVLVLTVPHINDMAIEDDNMVVVAVLRYRFIQHEGCWEIGVFASSGGYHRLRFRTKVPGDLAGGDA